MKKIRYFFQHLKMSDYYNKKYAPFIKELRYYNKLVHKPIDERSPYDLSQQGQIRKAKNKLERKLKELTR